MKKIIVVANWKMNPQSLAEAKRLFNLVKRRIKNIKNVEVVICPPLVYIPTFQHSNSPTVEIGAQNCFWEENGAFTGEVSPLMLKNLGCEYVILGHSERRRHFRETDETINKKIKAALRAGLKPILCVGETEEERRAGKTKEILKNQLSKSLRGVQHSKFNILNSLVIAYEPIWAIGTGKSCAWQDARGINLFVKNFTKKIRVLYGGSVNSQNSADYIKNAGFNGLLVGGASLDAGEFSKIIEIIAET